jgi:hypothetical protein
MNKWSLSIGCICLATLLASTGCGTTKGYSGADRPDSDLATIRGDKVIRKKKFFPDVVREQVFIQKIGDKTVGSFYRGWPEHVKVPAGQIEVEVRYFNEKHPQAAGAIPAIIVESSATHDVASFTLNAEAGREYIVRCYAKDWKKHDVDMWIEDSANGTVVSGKKPEQPLSPTPDKGKNVP